MMGARHAVALLAVACALALLWPMGVERSRSNATPKHDDGAAATARAPLSAAPAPARSAPAPAPLLVSAGHADRHPHPITKEHLRLYREADLLDGAAARLRKGATDDARVLLQQHAAEYSAGEGSDNQALQLLADCLDQRDAASVARVQAFYDRHTHSMTRRQLRKQCLQPADH